MATINSQLSVTNLDIGLTSSTSEAENKSSFLAVFESVQSEAEAKCKDKINLQERISSKNNNPNSALREVDLNHSLVVTDKTSMQELQTSSESNKTKIDQNELEEKNSLASKGITNFSDQQISSGRNDTNNSKSETKAKSSAVDNEKSNFIEQQVFSESEDNNVSQNEAEINNLLSEKGKTNFFEQEVLSESNDINIKNTEAEIKHSSTDKDKENYLGQKFTNEINEFNSESTNIELANQTISKDDSQSYITEESVVERLSDSALLAKKISKPEKKAAQDDVSITRSKEYQQLLKTDKNQEKGIPPEESVGELDKDRSVVSDKEIAKASTQVNSIAKTITSALTNEDNVVLQTEDASTFLEQLTKSQSINVAFSKVETEQSSLKNRLVAAPEKIVDTVEQEGDVKFNQKLISLEKEFTKLDKEGLATLKQFFAQINGVNTEQLGLSKQDIRQVIEKLNLALERIDTNAGQQSITLQSLLAKPVQDGIEITKDDYKKSDLLKANDKVQSVLSELIDDGKIISADKIVTITRPDKQTPHSLSAVGNAIAQAVTDDTQNLEQEVAEALNPQVASQVLASPLNQDAQQKQQARFDLNNPVKQMVVDSEDEQSEVELDLETPENEQLLSFSKLLNSLKNNANTPVLSQLVSQIQTNQFQQAELRDVNQQHAALQTAQVIQNTKQTSVSTEQALQQPVNIARSDAAKALFDKANVLLNLNLKEAEIRLDPPELGSMQIRIRSDAEQAQINFVVQSQQAKEMLEQSMGRLREMLAEQGINLGESNVSEQGHNEQQTAEHSGSSVSNDGSLESISEVSEQIVSKQQDGIDFYA